MVSCMDEEDLPLIFLGQQKPDKLLKRCQQPGEKYGALAKPGKIRKIVAEEPFGLTAQLKSSGRAPKQAQLVGGTAKDKVKRAAMKAEPKRSRRRQTGGATAGCLPSLSTSSCGDEQLEAVLQLEQGQAYQQPATSSFASNGAGIVEVAKVEQDVETSPAKSPLHFSGDLVEDGVVVPIPSFSDFGLDSSEGDCKELVLLPAAVSMDVSSEACVGSGDRDPISTRGSLDHISCLTQQQNESLQSTRAIEPVSEQPNPAPGCATSLVDHPMQQAASIGDTPSQPSLPSKAKSNHRASKVETRRAESSLLASGTKARNAANRGHMSHAAAFTLDKFQPGELVWARTGTRHEPLWPAKVVAVDNVPDVVRCSFVPDTLCVEYFGPASSKKWDKDYAWIKHGNIFPFLDFATWFCGQDLKKRAKDFCTAVSEALLCSSNLDSHSDPIPPKLLTMPTLVATEVRPGRGKAPSKGVNVPGGLGSSKECISCRAELKKKGRCKEGLEEGHAADLERVCQACYKLFENKQYCWVCKQIWLPNETDGWVGCDNSECGFWIHADCDNISPERLKAMEEEDAEYKCPRCRADQETAKVAAPAALRVECDGNEGDYLPAEHMIRCRCDGCLGRKKVEPSVFERHSKCREGNWGESIRVPRLKTSLIGWLGMMEGFKAEGLAYTGRRTPAAKAPDALASVQKRLDVPYEPIQVKWSGERCGVCHSEQDFEDDELITCDRCHVTVHELCYGVRRSMNGEKHPGHHETGSRGECPGEHRRGNSGSESGASNGLKHSGHHEAREKQRPGDPGSRNGTPQGESSPGRHKTDREEQRHCEPGSRNGALLGETRPGCMGGGSSAPGRRHKVWVCRACEDPFLKPHCCLCPVRGGALKPTSIEGRWAHVACAQWVTETQLADPAGAMEPIEGIERIPKARWDLECSICKQQCGAPIQCQQARCVKAYHVMCARLDGLYMKMVAKKDGMETRSYCRQHKAVKAEDACISSSLDAELLKRGVIPSRAKPKPAKKTVSVPEAEKKGVPVGQSSAARCRAYVPRKERQQEFVKRRPVPQLYEGATRHSRQQIEFLQQQCVVQDRVGDRWVAKRQPSAPEGLSVSGLIEHMQATEKSRLSFGKSGIHGWGLIARKTILEGDYVVDYRGTLVRPSVANLREQHYRRIGKDCYLFKVDDQHVVDATETGNLGRLINHSCGPNCYSQIKRVDGITRIILRAKRDVEAGEELTYDYRFEQEDKDRVPCHCGAPNCRKFMN